MMSRILVSGRCPKMKKSILISIRVSEEELDKFKQAARLELLMFVGIPTAATKQKLG
jgi:hypothetical protein